MDNQLGDDILWNLYFDFPTHDEPHSESGMNVGNSRSRNQDRDLLESVNKATESKCMTIDIVSKIRVGEVMVENTC